MNIVGKGNNVIDSELLSRLAVDQTSGSSISKKELQKQFKKIKSELKDEYLYSTRGLSRAERAIANTFSLAVKSGWLRAGASVKLVNEFLKGSDDDGLKHIVDDVKEHVKSHRTSSRGSGYGGYTRTPVRSNTSWGT